MLSQSFNTKEEATEAGFIFVGGKIIERITNEQGHYIGSIQRVDVTSGASFGYDWTLRAFANGASRIKLGDFGKSVELYIKNAKNQGGGTGAYHTNVFTSEEYEKAVEAARSLILEQAEQEIENSYD